jgi:hypothetical protein
MSWRNASLDTAGESHQDRTAVWDDDGLFFGAEGQPFLAGSFGQKWRFVCPNPRQLPGNDANLSARRQLGNGAQTIYWSQIRPDSESSSGPGSWGSNPCPAAFGARGRRPLTVFFGDYDRDTYSELFVRARAASRGAFATVS